MMASVGSQIGQFIERKRAEESLRQAQAELAHVARLTTLGELTASIAHEINQPLGAVVNNARLPACAGSPPRTWSDAQQSAVRGSCADGQRAGDIIGRIRALAQKAPPRQGLARPQRRRSGMSSPLARSEVQRHRGSLSRPHLGRACAAGAGPTASSYSKSCSI